VLAGIGPIHGYMYMPLLVNRISMRTIDKKNSDAMTILTV